MPDTRLHTTGGNSVLRDLQSSETGNEDVNIYMEMKT